jgi:hypothetical protein
MISGLPELPGRPNPFPAYLPCLVPVPLVSFLSCFFLGGALRPLTDPPFMTILTPIRYGADSVGSVRLYDSVFHMAMYLGWLAFAAWDTLLTYAVCSLL